MEHVGGPFYGGDEVRAVHGGGCELWGSGECARSGVGNSNRHAFSLRRTQPPLALAAHKRYQSVVFDTLITLHVAMSAVMDMVPANAWAGAGGIPQPAALPLAALPLEAFAAAAAAPGAPRKLPARERADIVDLLAEVAAATPAHVVGSAWVCSLAGLEACTIPKDELCARMAALLAEGHYDLASRVVDARLLDEGHWTTLLEWAIGYTEGGCLAPREHSARVLSIVFGGATSLGIVAVASACVRVTGKPSAAGGFGGASARGARASGGPKGPVDYKRAEPYPREFRRSELDLMPASYWRMAAGAAEMLRVDGVERLHTEFGFPRDARTSRILGIAAKYAFMLAPLSEAELDALCAELAAPRDAEGAVSSLFD